MIPTFTVQTEGAQLAIQDFGGEEGKPIILFAHAAGLCGATWQPLSEKISKSFRCFGVDLRSHGSSEKVSDNELDWHRIAADYEGIISTIKSRMGRETDTPVFGVGHSMGATTLLLAEIAASGLFTKIWNYEPIFFSSVSIASSRRTKFLANGARKRKKIFSSKDEAYQRYKKKLPLSLFDERCLKYYVDYGFRHRSGGSVELCCTPEDEAKLYESANSGITESIKKLKSPTLIAVGEDDGDRVPAIRQVLLENPHLPITLQEYSEYSHFGPQQSPNFFADRILEWCSR